MVPEICGLINYMEWVDDLPSPYQIPLISSEERPRSTGKMRGNFSHQGLSIRKSMVSHSRAIRNGGQHQILGLGLDGRAGSGLTVNVSGTGERVNIGAENPDRSALGLWKFFSKTSGSPEK